MRCRNDPIEPSLTQELRSECRLEPAVKVPTNLSISCLKILPLCTDGHDIEDLGLGSPPVSQFVAEVPW